MDYTHLGRSGLQVSRLCLGSLNFGPIISEEESHTLLDAALAAGINYLDTSNSYGRHTGRGRAEEIIGSWFHGRDGRREKTVLATKLFVAIDGWPNSGGLSALNIRRALDASLRRLQTDYIDVYQFHHIDRWTPWDEIWQAMDVAVQQGKIVYAGSSNFAAWHLAAAQESARRARRPGLVSEQSIYNLVTRDVEREVLPAASEYGLGFVAWSPLHEGLLGGAAAKERDGVRRLAGRAAAALDAHRDQLLEFEALADELGSPPAEVALAWLRHRPQVTAAIIGARTLEQLGSAVNSLEIRLDAEVMDRLDTIFPGYQTAPEAYAW
jgi:aryl-alcohol dehydrogenase-like predicted oxidoreductase